MEYESGQAEAGTLWMSDDVRQHMESVSTSLDVATDDSNIRMRCAATSYHFLLSSL